MTPARRIAELTIRAEAGEVRRASLWLESTGKAFDLPAEQVARLELCLNEALANVIAHGGPGALVAPVQLQLTLDLGAARAVLQLIDGGIAFDPLTHQSAPRAQSLDDIEPGGLGLIMMRESVDEIAYRREGGCNHLAFTVRWVEAPQASPPHLGERPGA